MPETDRLLWAGSCQIPCLEGLLFEAIHQLTQVVASIAKSGPEHYADISFFSPRLCLADLGKVIKSCFQFLLQEIAPYSKRNFVFFRIVGHKRARMHAGRSILSQRSKVFSSRFHVSGVPPVAAFRIRLPPFPPPFQKPVLAQKQRGASRDSTAPTHRPSIL